MAIRMPSQKKLLYYDTDGSGISNDAWTALASGGVGGGTVCLPKDLSILNRYGLDMTTRKGVPLVYRCRVTLHGMTFAGTGPAVAGFRGVQTFQIEDEVDNDEEATTTVTSADGFTTLKIDGVQNNWAVLEAAKKWHEGREEFLSQAGTEKLARGKYSHTIRYNFDGAGEAFVQPIDGDGGAFNGGTWDTTTIISGDDASYQLKLVGTGDDQETDAFTGSVLNMAHAYLLSRPNQSADTNPQTSETPAKFSALETLVSMGAVYTNRLDEVRTVIRDEQDNPPYEVVDISDSGDVNHDITEPVELGRVAVELGAVSRSMIVDVPFGLMSCSLQHYSRDDDAETFNPLVEVELLKISEMTG